MGCPLGARALKRPVSRVTPTRSDAGRDFDGGIAWQRGDGIKVATTKGTRMTYRCSCCGKSQDQVQRLIAGPGGVYICDECVDLCREIIEEEHTSLPPKTRTPVGKVPTPKKIYEQLNSYVIGQDKAKKTLAVA